MESGLDRFLVDFNKTYQPYPKQAMFHASTKPFNFLGGAAGPGKTLCGIVEDMISANEFNMDDGPKVHNLMLRRTQPKLESTLLTRFREKIPKELYASFNEVSKIVKWKNGATTRFGSMQHEHNAWDWQGEWFHIFYDELCEFTFKQWNATSAWNRCSVSPYTRKDGAGNPIGVGALWAESLFVKHRPCDEMDDSQRLEYERTKDDYAYFPCTYLDNPIYANDPQFLKNLMSYTKPVRDALMSGTWGVAGGYFAGAWDQAENVYEYAEIKPWHKRWISCDWGFEHWAAVYWHYMDDYGIIRTYKEVCVKHQASEVLAETIGKNSYDEDGSMPEFRGFSLSHDAYASNATKTQGADTNSTAARMTGIIREFGLPVPTNSGKDKLGREQLMYQLLAKRVKCGVYGPNETPVLVAAWQIHSSCRKLIETIPVATRQEKNPELIEAFLGDDPLQGAGYGLYMIAGKPGRKPWEEQAREILEPIKDLTAKNMMALKLQADRKGKQRLGRQY